MTNTILSLINKSKYKNYYYLSLIVPFILFNILIYYQVFSFTILLLIIYISITSIHIMCFELTINDLDSSQYDYLQVIKSENYIYLYRMISVFGLSSLIAICTSLIMNIIYFDESFIGLQLLYLIIILITNLFFTYFVLFVMKNINNVLLRNSLLLSISLIAMLSLMTRNLFIFIVYGMTLILFFLISFLTRRIHHKVNMT